LTEHWNVGYLPNR